MSALSVIGLDLSLTQTGFVVLHGGRLAKHGTVNPKSKGVPRLLEIEKAVEGLILEKECDDTLALVVLEDYAFSRPNQAAHIGELGGVIRRMIYQKQGLQSEYKDDRWDWIEVSPTAVKKFATGKGNSPKEIMLQQVFKRWGHEFKTSDEADAFVLAKIGEALLATERMESVELTSFQASVVAAILDSLAGKAKAPKAPKKPRKAG